MMYALADCNNFFVSCERVFRPDLENSAVVVLSNNDGCAVSRSNEAKALGIKMGEPLFEFAELVRCGKVSVFSSNYVLYGDMSRRVQMTLAESAPAIEVYSIDESFMDLQGMEDADLDVWAKRLSAKCRRNTGIPVSVGVAPTKTLAKIASKLCKQYPKLQGGCYMHREEDIIKVLEKFPLGDVWGIGRRYNKRFTAYGLTTALDFYGRSEEWVRREMGIGGVHTWRELHSQPCIEFDNCSHAKKQICVSRSFAKEIYDFDDLMRQVSMFCAMACEKLRKQQSACMSVSVFILTNRHKEGLLQQYEGRAATFAVATDSTIEINREVIGLLRSLFRQGYGYKKAGVVLNDLCGRRMVQGALFDNLDRAKHSRLMQTMDSINHSAGSNRIVVATQSTEGVRMNRNNLSPAYTTDINDILVVKV